MAKNATLWRTKSGYDTLDHANQGFSLLLENGDKLLLETGDELLLEDATVTEKSRTEWSEVSKNRTTWEDRDGFTTLLAGVSVTLLTEAGDTRVTESGETRVTEDVSINRKNPTEWSDD